MTFGAILLKFDKKILLPPVNPLNPEKKQTKLNLSLIWIASLENLLF